MHAQLVKYRLGACSPKQFPRQNEAACTTTYTRQGGPRLPRRQLPVCTAVEGIQEVQRTTQNAARYQAILHESSMIRCTREAFFVTNASRFVWHNTRSIDTPLDIDYCSTAREQLSHLICSPPRNPSKWRLPPTAATKSGIAMSNLGFVQQLASEKICQGHFPGRDQETVLVGNQMVGFEEILLEFWQLPCAFQRAPCYQQRNGNFGVPMLSSAVQITEKQVQV